MLYGQTFAIPYEYPIQRNYKVTKKKIREESTIEDMFFKSKVVLIKYAGNFYVNLE